VAGWTRFWTVLLIFSSALSVPAGSPAWAGAAAAGTKSQRSKCNLSAFRVVVDVGHTLEVPGA